jgi:hypothetical protein
MSFEKVSASGDRKKKPNKKTYSSVKREIGDLKKNSNNRL